MQRERGLGLFRWRKKIPISPKANCHIERERNVTAPKWCSHEVQVQARVGPGPQPVSLELMNGKAGLPAGQHEPRMALEAARSVWAENQEPVEQEEEPLHNENARGRCRLDGEEPR